MKINSKENYVEILLIETSANTLPVPAVNLSVSIKSYDFCGKGTAWVTKENLITFIDELDKVDKSRKGSVSLEGMSKDIFTLKIYSTDNKGHMAIAGTIGKRYYSGEVYFNQSCSYGFEFEPSLLESTTVYFRQLIRD